MRSYKSREIPCEFYYLVEKFMKKAQIRLDREGQLEIGCKFLIFSLKID